MSTPTSRESLLPASHASAGSPGSLTYRRWQRAALLNFAAGARTQAGFGYLGDSGELVPGKPVELYVTGRMTHVFSLGVLLGEEPAAGGPDAAALRELAQHGVDAFLDGPLRDHANGGWFAGVDENGGYGTKQAYAHAFVILAAASAATAGIPRADELLELALAVHESKFWDESVGMVVEEWSQDWSELDPYRGVNSCMHTVEAYLAAGAATGNALWFERAARIGARVAGWGAKNDWRLPEHFDSAWEPQLEMNKDRPADQFRPYGATVGHGLEWSRLLLTLGTVQPGCWETFHEAALELAARAIADGWNADGAEGFIYTTDWSGKPIVRERMHWVLTEAIATSTVLHWATGNANHGSDLERWWRYADRYLIDSAGNSWRHELSPENQPSALVWPGRPDAYHAFQACLMADVLGSPSFAAGAARLAR